MDSFTSKQFHTSQILLATETKRVSSRISIALLISGLGLSVSCLIPSHWIAKTTNLAIACGLFTLAYRLDRLADYGDRYKAIDNQVSEDSYQGWLGHALKPPKAEVAIAPTIEPIKFTAIEKALSKPHVMILGETGSGKSTLCKYLVSQVNAPCVIIDPHATPSDWQGFKVIGAGRKYQNIAAEFERLIALMQLRYEARDKGISQFAALVVIIDEFPAIASELGKDATAAVKLLARESRKVSIKMVLLSQGAEVKTLGLEGEGSIRECFAMLRLGNFALTYAKQSKDIGISEAISTSSRPAMLDNLPCNLPTLPDAQSLPVLPLPRDYLDLLTNATGDTVQPSFESLIASSTPVISSAQPKLSAPLEAILDYASRQGDYVSARKIQSGVRMFRDATANEIRGYFQWLSDRGYGTVRGEAESLEFSAG
jgi:hypothetical protein